ncbi:hypothetical protein AGDE_12307 [Angomonas deanei]|nr:hypothetical protein AGDE_12307 [Angomonas deanei]|eukprot:EPY24517.1 hypothetical protein AGDE_12307 [Angomonas deanei]
MSAREYRAHLRAGAFSSPELFEEWIAHVGTRRTATTEGEDSTSPAATTTEEDSSTIKEAPSTSTRSAEELEAEREERRLRGEQADLTDTAALSGLPLSDLKHTPREAFPFLRKRAVEEEHTLDPSLVDWTAKYYPEDTKDTFARPPKVRSDQSQEAAPTEVVEQESAQRERGPSRSAHARHRLNQSLRKHDDHYRATFDADGVFFHMRTPDFSDEENDRTPRPRQVKGSELDDTLRKKRGVVKVPWNVAAKAQEQGYSTDILRSKDS